MDCGSGGMGWPPVSEVQTKFEILSRPELNNFSIEGITFKTKIKRQSVTCTDGGAGHERSSSETLTKVAPSAFLWRYTGTPILRR